MKVTRLSPCSDFIRVTPDRVDVSIRLLCECSPFALANEYRLTVTQALPGGRIISGSGDNTIRIWDGDPIATDSSHGGQP
jgi:hypothetical protein